MTEEKQTPHQVYDRGYKLLLSLWKIIKQLVEGYVEGEWRDSLLFEEGKLMNTDFISRDFEERESDVLYKIPLAKEERDIYLYLHVEHQSTIDQVMAFRVLNYLTDTWRYFYNNSDKRKRKGFKFPSVFAIVLYNGKTPWSAPTSMKDLVDGENFFGEYIPNVKYHLIDIPRLNKDNVRDKGNALSTVFLLEQNIEVKDIEEVKAVFDEALSFLNNEKDEEVRKTVIDWVRMHLKVKFPKSSEVLDLIDISKHCYQEIKTMIETLPEKLVALGEEKGVVKGRQEGRKEGRQEIAIKMLRKKIEVSEIGELTDLTEQEVQELKEKHNL